MILARALHPWYDERFAGYGWDKVRSHAGSIGRGRPVVLQRLSRPPSVHALHDTESSRAFACFQSSALPLMQMGLPECLFYWGGSFVVHPRGFVVHVPHERSATFHASMKDNKKGAYEVRG